MLRHSDCITRQCSRCGQELTDAASREAGVGPICRKKDNVIFARTIPANLIMAGVAVLQLSIEDFPEPLHELFEENIAKFHKQVEKARKKYGNGIDAIPGADFRFFVDFLDYALSYNIKYETRQKFVSIVSHLGYVALASVLSGEACMSPARLFFNESRTHICLSGKSNKTGYYAFKKAFGNKVQLPKYRGDKTPYMVHVSYASDFIDIAFKYWPFIETEIGVEGHKIMARTFTLACQPDNPQNYLPEVSITQQEESFVLKTSWINDEREKMTEMIANIKKIPWKERKYDAVSKAWIINSKHQELVKQIVNDSGLYKAVV